MRVEQRVDGNDRRRGARRAAAQAARKRQAFRNAEHDAAALAERGQQRLRGDAGGVARRVAAAAGRCLR